jgi:hypothetical protein
MSDLATATDERELVLFDQDDLQLWHARRPGFSIFGSFTGRVVLTSTRLLFLSSGGSGAGRRLLIAATLGPAGSLLWGQTPTADLDLGALADEGSAAIPLGAITNHAAQRRCDCATYVAVQYEKDKGTVAEVAFMPKNSVAWRGAQDWASRIDQARAAFASQPFR